jgi:hypothetical protein
MRGPNSYHEPGDEYDRWAGTTTVGERPAPEPEPSSWTPVDLCPYLNGTVERVKPTLGAPRSDGLRLLYAGLEHSVMGEMESGKSWLALMCAAAELADGRTVVYVHFEETSPADTVERLQLLGVPGDEILVGFRFVGPDERVKAGDLAVLLAEGPSLVIFDGVNEGMTLHGWKIREEDGAAAFRRYLVKPCIRTGAATLALDHVVKDREKRGRDALGSVHKGNAVNGASFAMETAEPFARGMRGRAHLYVVKDRPGHLRRHGRATKLPGKDFLGELVIDASGGVFDAKLWAPRKEDKPTQATVDPDVADDDLVYASVLLLNTAEKPANMRNIQAQTGIRRDRTMDALTRLVLVDRLVEVTGPRNSRLFTVPQDQSPGVSS